MGHVAWPGGVAWYGPITLQPEVLAVAQTPGLEAHSIEPHIFELEALRLGIEARMRLEARTFEA